MLKGFCHLWRKGTQTPSTWEEGIEFGLHRFLLAPFGIYVSLLLPRGHLEIQFKRMNMIVWIKLCRKSWHNSSLWKQHENIISKHTRVHSRCSSVVYTCLITSAIFLELPNQGTISWTQTTWRIGSILYELQWRKYAPCHNPSLTSAIHTFIYCNQQSSTNWLHLGARHNHWCSKIQNGVAMKMSGKVLNKIAYSPRGHQVVQLKYITINRVTQC